MKPAPKNVHEGVNITFSVSFKIQKDVNKYKKITSNGNKIFKLLKAYYELG